MKYFYGAIVIIMIFVIPAGSWYYLQSGLDYRKAALKDLEPKGELNLASIAKDRFLKKTTLIQTKKTEENLIGKLYGQYGGQATFQLLSSQAVQDTSAENWTQLTEEEVMELRSKYADKSYFIIDTSGQLRNSYANEPKELKKMIEHIAIVLPRLKEVDIKMRKDGGK